HAVLVFAEFFHARHHALGLLLGVIHALFIGAFFVGDEFQKERNIVGAAFVANAFHPGMLDVVYLVAFHGIVIKQNLDAIGARFFQAADRPVIEQIGEAAGSIGVVAGFFIREQQARGLAARASGRQSPLRVEQNGAG